MSLPHDVARHLNLIRQRIADAEAQAGRAPGSVALLAVSKTKPAAAMQAAIDAGQRAFGENYLTEALEKIEQLAGQDCEWHFVGAIQSTKTRPRATHFDWVHCVDREKIARRLSEQRPAEHDALNVCIQVNIDRESTKAGVLPEDAEALASVVSQLPQLRLRGLMAIPLATDETDRQRQSTRALKQLFDKMQAQHPNMDTLSIGMSGDMEAAIQEGSTMVRVGTGVFGARPPRESVG
ncbi:MAG: YggS family pyridoxal phosphate-dependent enzyme [Pseudomonadota bacterium]